MMFCTTLHSAPFSGPKQMLRGTSDYFLVTNSTLQPQHDVCSQGTPCMKLMKMADCSHNTMCVVGNPCMKLMTMAGCSRNTMCVVIGTHALG